MAETVVGPGQPIEEGPWPLVSAPAGGESPPRAKGKPKPRRHRSPATRGHTLFGWIFVSPALAVLLLFLVIPIILSLYVSFTDWSGTTNPLSSQTHWTGLANYRTILTHPGLYQTNFGTAIRNNFYYVLFVVPLQTAFALWLAILVNNKFLRGKSFFRTAFYFPSVTSSIAITTVFIFLFTGTGAINQVLSFFHVNGPDWLYDQRGIITTLLNNLGVHNPPSWANFQILGVSVWNWFAGPSFGMLVIIILAIWTTSGTFMLFFLGGLQSVPEEAEEASEIDGATAWQRFRFVTLPLIRPVLILVLTLGFISTWQVFDQSYLTGANNPTMVTPAFLAYQVSFSDFAFGQGAAIAFLLFAFIVVLTLIQRRFVKEDLTKWSARSYRSRPRQVIVYVSLVIFALLYLAPFALQIANSFKTAPDATANGLSLVPHPPTLQAWQEIFGIGTTGVTDVPRWFFNSAFVAIILTISRVFLDSLAGYALARLHFRGRKYVLALVIATLAVPGVVLLIPRFLVIKELGLFNSYTGMILPIAVDAAGIFLMRQFFLQVPVSLEEAARIDGAGIFTTFWRIVLPAVKSGVIVLTIISFQGAWNEFAWFETATNLPNYYTLTTGLANITNGGLSAGTQFPLKLAAALLTTIPIAVLFFAFQRQLVRGRLEGAVKQ